MSWSSLQGQGRIRTHQTSPRELADLRGVIARNLADATVVGLSYDRRFAIAYEAALQLGKMVIACEGHRVAGEERHRTTFEGLELAMGSWMTSLTRFFEVCRRKRNKLEYDVADTISATEADEIVSETAELRTRVEAWIAANHAGLS